MGTYPNAAIDPRKKDYQWIMQYSSAAYRDSRGYMMNGQINVGNLKMSEIKMYGMGRQSVDKYKKITSPGNPQDPSWRATDWTPPAFMCKFREIGISQLCQKQFDISASAVDPMAKSEEDEYFNKMKVKLLMREEAMKQGSDLADSPLLKPQPGEPEDMEQLAMVKDFGYKHVMAMEAENAIRLVNEQNDSDEMRKLLCTSLYDYGIAAKTQWIDENGMVKEKVIDMEYFGSSYFEKPDGSDMVHWFEIVPTYVADLAPFYTKAQLDEICKKSLSRNGNPNSYTPFNGYFNKAWNRFKVMVMHIKFLSWNDTVYKEETDSRDNMRFGKSSYENKQFLTVNKDGKLEGDEGTPADNYNDPLDETGTEGSATPQYLNSCRKVVYKASWVIETEFMHNYGLQENQNRKLSSWWDTDLDLQLYAWNFYKMQFTGITERLIPLEDKACMSWFNLQNLSNKLVPYLINIDMNAVEGAFPYGKGGTKGKPSDVMDFIFSNFVVPYRSTDLLSRNPNYKPVSIEASGQLAAFGHYYEELQQTINMMQMVSGLNELTDASTPNAKTLVPVAQAAVQSSSNALYLISEAEKSITKRSADAVIQKVQIAVGLGKVAGYAKALGSTTVQFFQINPDISLHELGIFIDEAPSQSQREALWNDVSLKESQGLLTVADKYFIMTCRNLQEAAKILDYKIQKRKEEQQQFELQKIQESNQGQMKMTQQTAKLTSQAAIQQGKIDMEKLITEMMWQYEIEKMKKSSDLQGETVQADARTVGHQIQSHAKIVSSQIAAGSNVHAKHVQGQYDLVTTDMDNEAAKEKQKIANKKPIGAKK